MSLEKLLPYYIVDTRSSIESTKTYAEIWYKKAFKRNLVTRHLSDFFFEKKNFFGFENLISKKFFWEKVWCRNLEILDRLSRSTG